MTTNIIPVFTAVVADETVQLCNARELHATLQVGRDFATWMKERIETYGFIDGEDFVTVTAPPIRGAGNRGKRTDYHLTLDTAKELAMVENNDIGRQIRRYLIRLEKKAIAAGLKVDAVVSRAQIGEMSTRMAERFPEGKDRPYAWSRFNNHFRLASYKDLPTEQYEAALAYIDQMPGKGEAKQKLTANTESGQKKITPPAISDYLQTHINQAAIKALSDTKFALSFVLLENGQLMPQVFSHHKDAQTFVPAGIVREVRDRTFGFFPDDMIPDLISAISHRLRVAA